MVINNNIIGDVNNNNNNNDNNELKHIEHSLEMLKNNDNELI